MKTRALLIMFFIPALALSSKLMQASDTAIYFSADYAYASTKTDTIDGANYRSRFKNPWIAALTFSKKMAKGFNLGARYEYWHAICDYTLNGQDRKDTLNLHTAGLESSFRYGNPRVNFALSFGVHYPFVLQVRSTAGTFQSSTKYPLLFQIRASTFFQLSKLMIFNLEAGYRLTNLGSMKSGDTYYLAPNDKLDLSGFFLGAGLGISF